MQQLAQILKRMQKPLQQLNGRKFKDIHSHLALSRAQLEDTQHKLHQDPSNNQLQEKEKEDKEKYIDILNSSIKLMRQQSKMDWINEGDHCTKFFFAKMKQR